MGQLILVKTAHPRGLDGQAEAPFTHTTARVTSVNKALRTRITTGRTAPHHPQNVQPTVENRGWVIILPLRDACEEARAGARFDMYM